MSTETQKRTDKVFHYYKPFSVLLIMLLLSACRVVRGSGNVMTETRAVSDFDQVSLSAQGEIILRQGEQEALEIEAEDNIMAVIETQVRGNTLYISSKNNTAINPTKPVKFLLMMKDVSGFNISGSGSIDAEDVETERLTLEISGSGDVNIASLSAASLVVEISGSGNLELAGRATNQVIDISGSGDYQAADLVSEAVDVGISGSGEVTVWASQSLSADISGRGTVNYYGNPSVSQRISGTGELNSLGIR